MPETRLYRPRAAQPVAAVQFTGDNSQELIDLLGACFDHDDESGEAAVLTTRHSSWTTIEPGMWVLLASGGVITAMGNDEFTEAFEPVEADSWSDHLDTPPLDKRHGPTRTVVPGEKWAGAL